MPLFIDNRARPVRLGSSLGRGGQGEVFAVVDEPDRVAKIYHSQLSILQQEKLTAMVVLAGDDRLAATAWPLATLHHQARGDVVGYVMPRVNGFKELHSLHGPKSRQIAFPNADWRFLIHAATNTARAFSKLHQLNIVVGDVNDRNVLVSQQGTVKLIDCDSFQISRNGRVYYCPVGVATHTAPEMQGKSFETTLRSPNHDVFGLAILIFQLLFLGRHPFSGVYSGKGDMPIERAIRECRFAYGYDAASRQMLAPPNAPLISTVTAQIGAALSQSFSEFAAQGGTRVSASEWVNALTALSASLALCPANGAHRYLNSLKHCPWCAIEASANVVLFRPLALSKRGPSSNFDLATIWSQIVGIGHPGPLSPLPNRLNIKIAPLPRYVELGHIRRIVVRIGAIIVILCALLVMLLPIDLELKVLAIGMVLLLAFGAYHFLPLSWRKARQNAESEFRLYNHQWQEMERRWQAITSEPFDSLLADLSTKRLSYLNLDQVRAHKLHQLHASRQRRQLNRHLDGYRIDRASIPGIGVTRAATLQSFGIETAKDITSASVSRVPGFGPHLTTNLLNWRNDIERRFRFDPNRGIYKADLDALDNEIASLRSKLQQDLLTGATRLRQVREQILQSRKALEPSLETALRNYLQAEINYQAL